MDRKIILNEPFFKNNTAKIYGNNIASYTIDVKFVKDENITEDIFYKNISDLNHVLKGIPSGQKSKGFGGWRSFEPIYVAEVDHYG